MGFTYPLPENLIGDFLQGLEKVLVVEELEPFLEEAVKAIAQGRGLTLPIRGKGPGLFSPALRIPPGPGCRT